MTESTAREGTIRSEHLRAVLVLLALFTLLWLLDLAKDALVVALGGPPVEMGLVAGSLHWWLEWMLLAPVMAWLLVHVRVDRQGAARTLGIHGIASLVLAVLHLSMAASVNRWALSELTLVEWQSQFALMFQRFAFVDVVVYWATAGAWFGIPYYRRYRDRELAAARLAAHTEELERQSGRRHEARDPARRPAHAPHPLIGAGAAPSPGGPLP